MVKRKDLKEFFNNGKKVLDVIREEVGGEVHLHVPPVMSSGELN